MVVVVFVLLASSLKVLCPRRLGTKGLAMESASSSFVAILVVVRIFFRLVRCGVRGVFLFSRDVGVSACRCGVLGVFLFSCCFYHVDAC